MEEQTKRLVLAALVIMLGGNAGDIYRFANPVDTRPDPFTGTMGHQLEARCIERDSKIQRELEQEISGLKERIVRNETKVSECLRKIQ